MFGFLPRFHGRFIGSQIIGCPVILSLTVLLESVNTSFGRYNVAATAALTHFVLNQ